MQEVIASCGRADMSVHTLHTAHRTHLNEQANALSRFLRKDSVDTLAFNFPTGFF